MATTKYNPYKAAQKITDLKGKYHNARQMNDNYQQYADEAVQYYAELYNNGEKELADRLAAVDYRGASDILAGLPTEEDVAFNEWYDNIGKVASGDKRTVSEQQTDYIDKLMGIGTGETSPQTSDAVSKLMDQWFSDNQTYIDRSGELHDAGMSGLDSLLNYDYTQQSFYQPIMDTYNLYGDNAANGALATGAAGNAGNIDSYAAANAARQQLAFTNAGHQAALAAAAQNQGSYLDLYGMMGANNSDLRLNNATTMNAINNMYSTDANERQAANDVIRQLFGDESAERVNATNAMVDKYLADLGLVQSQYVTDADERMNTANNEYGLALQQLANESGLSVAQLQAVVDREKAQLGYASDLARVGADRYATDKNYEATLRETYNKILSEERIKAAENELEREKLAAEDRTANILANSTQSEAEQKNQIRSYVENALALMEEGDDTLKTYNAVLKYADYFDNQNFGGKYSDYIRDLVKEHKTYAS
jgi:hypothetical protein